MLVELLVENYAVVEQARIRFHPGLNLLTGETGSGKSIVVDALGLLFGARASPDVVRSDAQRARVSGVFSIKADGGLTALLDDAGLQLEDGELIIEREVTSAGKSRAFAGNRPVTTQFLRQLAPFLGDIHGQNQQQALFTEATQRGLLDEFARAGELRDSLSKTFEQWRECGGKLEELNRNEQEKLRLLDLWSFQKTEIEAIGPKPGEDGELNAERHVLQNVSRLQEHANAAYDLLYESPGSVTANLRSASKRVEELIRIDPQLGETAALLKQAIIAVDESASNLRDYLGRVENDPARLEEVETRLAGLERLKRKYGSTIDLVLAFLSQVKQQIDEVENATERRQALEKQLAELASLYEKVAAGLTAKRHDAAIRLAKQVEQELTSLAMSGTEFQIGLTLGPWTASGRDVIEFLVSPNVGEPMRPLDRVASGGELSRLSLALKTVVGASHDEQAMPTLVFDEVDAGVGGAAAASVGKRLKRLSRSNQVICVTHLAQIAGFANHHYAVFKREKKGRTTTEVEELNVEDRAREIGRMLSGEKITPEALKQAERLIHAGSAS